MWKKDIMAVVPNDAWTTKPEKMTSVSSNGTISTVILWQEEPDLVRMLMDCISMYAI